MDQLDRLRVFVRVAELGSFTRAAEALGMQKATVSAAVQRLEDELGARLLQRTTRRVALTQEGRLCHERARDLLGEAEELRTLFRQSPQRLTGRLRIDMPVGLAQNHVLPALPGFTAQHPELSLEISATDRRVDLLQEGFDCVVRVGRVTEQGLVVRPLGRARVITCASPAYLAQSGTPRTLEDLPRHRVVGYSPSFSGRPEGWEYFDGREYREVPMHCSVTVNSAAAYVAACRAGYGLIQIPAFGTPPDVASGALVQVLPQYEAEPMPVSLLYLHRRHQPLRVRAFMDWIDALVRPLLLPP